MAGYGQFCAVARAHEVLGGRWTPAGGARTLVRQPALQRHPPRHPADLAHHAVGAAAGARRDRRGRAGRARARIRPHRGGAGAGGAGRRARPLGPALAAAAGGGGGSRPRAAADRPAPARRFRRAAPRPDGGSLRDPRPPAALPAADAGRGVAVHAQPGLSGAALRPGTARRPGRLVARRHRLRRGAAAGPRGAGAAGPGARLPGWFRRYQFADIASAELGA